MKQEAKPAEFVTFTIERVYPSTPEKVFRAFADVDAKAKWFAGPNEWKVLVREQDFRVGGRERVRGRFPDGHESDFQAVYHDIVANQRIIWSYDMFVDEKKISVSLVTVEIGAHEKGAHLRFTEQVVFFDGYDDRGGREKGTAWLMDKLGASLG